MKLLKDPQTNWKYILIVVILAALVGGGIYFLQDKFLIEKEVALSPPTIPAPAVKTLPPKICPSPDELSDVPASELAGLVDLPEFFPEASWEKVSASEPHFGESRIFCGFGRIICGDSYICGDEWVTRINVSTYEEMWSKVDAFREYFRSELSKRGWAWRVNVRGFELTGAAADEPCGMSSTWGYIKVQNERLRTIILDYSSFVYGPERIGDEWAPCRRKDCPCEIEFRIFISKIISLDEFLP